MASEGLVLWTTASLHEAHARDGDKLYAGGGHGRAVQAGAGSGLDLRAETVPQKH
jgi:hypothetical protein